MPIGDYAGPPADQNLPFGHVEMQVPVEVPSWLGFNSKKRNRLIAVFLTTAELIGLRIAVLDDYEGGRILCTVQGPRRKIEAFSQELAKVDLDSIPGSTEPRPFSNREG